MTSTNKWYKFLTEQYTPENYAYLLFHFPSKRLYWIETDSASASSTPKNLELPKGRILTSWVATSGKSDIPELIPDPKSVSDQISNEIVSKLKNMVKIGPLPPGLYFTHDHADIPWFWRTKIGHSVRNAMVKAELSGWPSFRGATNWFGGEQSWGQWRVWLEPNNRESSVRYGFTIHGGEDWGSSGCIDLSNQILNFKSFYVPYIEKYKTTMNLYSYYGKLPDFLQSQISNV